MEEVLGFAAFGGLERVAIIAGALLVGYWGYRLYVSAKPVGLAFLGISCAMLFGALLTGGSHVRAVGESIQLASSRAPDAGITGAGPESVDAVSTGAATGIAINADPSHSGETDLGSHSPQSPLNSSDTTESSQGNAPVDSKETTGHSAPPTGVDTPSELAIAAIEPDTLDTQPTEETTLRSDRLPTAQELGGRIVSVKSGNLSLEWSPASGAQ